MQYGPGGIVGVMFTQSTVKRWALSCHITSCPEGDVANMRLAFNKTSKNA